MATVTISRDLNIFTTTGLLAQAVSIPTFYGLVSERKTTALGLVALLFIAGIACIAVGVSLYSDEREQLATQSIASQVQQEQKREALEGTTHEVAIFSGIMFGLIGLIGLSIARSEINQQDRRRHLLYLLYIAAWLGAAFSVSANSQSLSDINGNRLAFLVPGAVLLGMVPFLMHEQVLKGEAWLKRTSGAVVALFVGSILFDIGIVYQNPASEFVNQLIV